MIVFLLLVAVIVLILPGSRSPLASVLVFSCIVPLICLVPFLLELLSGMAFGPTSRFDLQAKCGVLERLDPVVHL